MNEEYSIPKIIHYCWFGKKEKPEFIKKCIESWKIYLPAYEIREWNEDNFNITINNFVRQAYEAKKFAFVSDYVRLYALYNYGGIYLDTDVEILKNFDCFLHHESFWGFEEKNFIATSTIGSSKGNEVIKQFLDSYERKIFLLPDGSYDTSTNVSSVTKLLITLGLKQNGQYQELDCGAVIYPQAYFSPYDYINLVNNITGESFSVHYFYKSWIPFKDRIKAMVKKMLVRCIGVEKVKELRNIYNK